MIEKTTAEAVLARAMRTGADYAELYMEDAYSDRIAMIADCIDSVTSSRNRGAGVRVFKGTNSVYVYGNGTDEASLLSLAERASAAIEGVKGECVDITLTPRSFAKVCPAVIPYQSVEAKIRAEALKEVYFAAKNYSPEIRQVRGNLNSSFKNVLVANSEGVFGTDERPYIRIAVSAVASDGVENQSGSFAPGNSAGFEFIQSLDLKAGGISAAKTAVTMLHAGKCPAGKMPVVLDNGFGGVIFHEACGHSLEATSVALGNSVFCGKLGQKIANECVCAYDDGTLLSNWGSLSMNDEGEAPQRITLIKDGILNSYMIDKLGSRRMKLPSTGSGRRQDYAFAPTSRMTNTYIGCGKDKKEDIISSVPYGLYASQMGGGSVNPVTGVFNFSVLEGYMIKDGKIAEPVRGATLIGKGYEILHHIDMISDNLDMGQGMCGSISGSIPTNVGQPMLRINEITVGGEVE